MATKHKATADGILTRMKAIAARLSGRDPDAPDYAEERSTTAEAMRLLDVQLRAATAAHETEARQGSAALRAKAEAERDPATRTADELERARLAASGLDASEFVAQARAMAAGGQPRRAQLLLGVAADKGGRVPHDLAAYVETLLDEEDPDRRAAAVLDDDLDREMDDYNVGRLTALAAVGGIDASGFAGDDSAPERASANMARKMSEYAVAQKRGEAYHPAEADLATGDPDANSPARFAELDRARAQSRKRTERAVTLAGDPGAIV